MNYIDASALKLLYCKRLFYLKVIRGFRERELKNDMVAGSAVHKFLRERHYVGVSKAALDASIWFASQKTIISKPYLDATYIHNACHKIATLETPYRVLDFGTKNAVVEQSFQIPLSPSCSFVGTIDELAEDSTKNLVFNDFKTTGSGYDSKSKTQFLNSFTRSTQFLSYFWGIKKHIQAFPRANLSSKNFLGGVVTAIFLNKDSVDVQSSGIITFTQDQLDYFEEQLFKLIKDMPGNDPTGLFSNQCVSGRNYPCEMLDYCKYHEKDETYLKENYNQEEYKPMDWY